MTLTLAAPRARFERATWLDSCTDLKPKTRHQYSSLLTLHVLPTWRIVPLAKITFEGLSLRCAIFLPARARAGLSGRFRIHDLRHTAASLIIQAGYPPKMLQEIMVHASITTTLDLYVHHYPGDMDRYADRLDSASTALRRSQIRPDDENDDPDPGHAAR